MDRKKIYNDEFLSYWLLAELGELQAIWKKETEKMTEESYKEIVFKSDFLVYKKYAPMNYLLVDARCFYFTLGPELQIWITENLTPAIIEAGIGKVAIIMPSEFYAYMSFDQTMQEVNTSDANVHKTAYFDDWEKARAWFYEDE